MSRIVLDCAVSRPLDPEAAQWLAMAATRAFASPTGGYHEAKVSQALLQQAGQSIAELTGGARAWFRADTPTAVAHAVLDVAVRGRFDRVLTTATDPLAVLEGSAAAAAQLGVAHEVLPVDAQGRLTDLRGRAVLVTSAANQEIGCVQRDVGHWLAQTESAVVLDASCALGWIDLPDRWDRLVLDPRAWGSVPGAVAVVSADHGPPATFDNVPAAVVAGLTAQRWLASAPGQRDAVGAQVRHMATRIAAEVPDVQIHGGGAGDLPQILSVSVLYVDAEALQTALDIEGYAVGSGSACTSLQGQPSHVLGAIGALTGGNVRLGLPPGLSESVVREFIDVFVTTVARVREQLGTTDL